MLLQPVTHNLGFADASSSSSGVRINAKKDVNAGLVCFLAGQQIIKFSAWSGKGFASPIDQFGCSQALCFAFRKEEFDCNASHN